MEEQKTITKNDKKTTACPKHYNFLVENLPELVEVYPYKDAHCCELVDIKKASVNDIKNATDNLERRIISMLKQKKALDTLLDLNKMIGALPTDEALPFCKRKECRA
ncbi:MAG: hypothetical protein V6Z82_05105 [Flavobacteriales bacterium]